MQPIAIVRSAALSALGGTLGEAVESIRLDRPSVRPPQALEQSTASRAGAGEVDLGVEAARSDDRAERLLRRALQQLLGAEPASTLDEEASRVAVVVGTTLGGMRHFGRALRCDMEGDANGAFDSFIKGPAGAVLRDALSELPIRGPSITISCACASALSAIAHGCALLNAGDADVAIVGGYDPISEFVYGGFSALQLVASDELSPFAPDRAGMKLGEGCALFLLRRSADANRRGERVIATIEAIGESSDAHHLTQPHPDGRGAAAALESATRRNLPDLLLAHGTGTPGNDGAEYAAYRAVFGQRLSVVPVAALKSRLGHPLGAAGALELSVALACADTGMLPSGAGRAPDTASFPDLDLLRGAPRAGSPQRITVLAAGFGGANAALTVRRNDAAAGVTPPRGAMPSTSIVGWGSINGGGRGVEGLLRLRDGASPLVDEALLATLLDRARSRRLALLPRLVLAAARDLCDSIGLAPSELRETPVLVATWHGAADFTDRYYRDLIQAGIDLANPLLFAESVPNIGSGHLSLGLGITAPSASVIGTRTAGFEALALARARLRSGGWRRALVVAADESHATIDSVLSKCTRQRVAAHAGAVAMLLEAREPTTSLFPTLHQVAPAKGRISGLSSHSPIDVARIDPQPGETGLPELGAATGPATLALAIESARLREGVVGSCDPSGMVWSVQFGAPGPR